jgi:hypothetical protein
MSETSASLSGRLSPTADLKKRIITASAGNGVQSPDRPGRQLLRLQAHHTLLDFTIVTILRDVYRSRGFLLCNIQTCP